MIKKEAQFSIRVSQRTCVIINIQYYIPILHTCHHSGPLAHPVFFILCTCIGVAIIGTICTIGTGIHVHTTDGLNMATAVVGVGVHQ